MRRIGLISDTHDYFEPRLPSLFAGVDRILHAGDIGSWSVLIQLEAIAPVTAVAGNSDVEVALPFTEQIELTPCRTLLQHIVNPLELNRDLLHILRQDSIRIVVFGHTHRPFCKQQDGILFANPGYAGKARFRMPRSIAILSLNADTPPQVEFHPLS